MEYQYQRTGHFFAQVASGLETLAADELKLLGASEIQEKYRGLYFKADKESLYRINYTSRLITRVLAPLLTFDCHSDKYLYKTAMDFPWEELFTPDQTFAVFSQVSNSNIKHSKFAALRLKDGIVDRFREKKQRRPNVDAQNPDIWFNLNIQHNRAVINLDTSGISLHKRGYRQDTVEAPMQETLAAALVKLSGWQGETALIDPMCGSGTIPAEAYMALTGLPSGYFRKTPGFRNLPDFDAKLWQTLKQQIDGSYQRWDVIPIQASDVDHGAVRVARRNLEHLPGGEQIAVKRMDYSKVACPEGSTLIMNPPYGIRLRKQEDLGPFYKQLGDWLKQNARGSHAYIYFGDRKYLKFIGLKPDWKKPLMNGGLDGRLAKFVLF